MNYESQALYKIQELEAERMDLLKRLEENEAEVLHLRQEVKLMAKAVSGFFEKIRMNLGHLGILFGSFLESTDQESLQCVGCGFELPTDQFAHVGWQFDLCSACYEFRLKSGFSPHLNPEIRMTSWKGKRREEM